MQKYTFIDHKIAGHCYFWHIFCKTLNYIIYLQLKNSIAEAEKLMSRQEIKSCARHSFRDHKMKNFIITTVMALLIGAFAFTADAQDRKFVRPKAKTEKQVNPESRRQSLKNNVNENSTKAQKEAKQTLKLKKEADEKTKAEVEKKAIKENNDLFDEFVKTVENCEIEHNKKPIDKIKISQYLEEALRLSTKINTKMLTDGQKVTFEECKVKLNGFLKG
jgi:hypothetical protein